MGWQDALGSVATTAQGFGSGGSGSSGAKKSATDKFVGVEQAAKKIADAIKGSSKGYTDDAGMSDTIGSFKKGGMVKKTGLAKLHAGERVLTKKQTKTYGKKKTGAK